MRLARGLHALLAVSELSLSPVKSGRKGDKVEADMRARDAEEEEEYKREARGSSLSRWAEMARPRWARPMLGEGKKRGQGPSVYFK